jgi:peptidoglycan hydrolase-like protein with peptidoglycan-binding domain
MSLCSFLGKIFDKMVEPKVYIHKNPMYGDKGDHVKALQTALNARGAKLTVDGHFGLKTKTAVSVFQKSFGSLGSGIVGMLTLEKLGLVIGEKPSEPPVPGSATTNPAYVEAKKYIGKTEFDSTFNKWLSGFWKIVGLPGYKTIIGTSFAWCGLFIAAMNSEVGQKWMNNGAGARNWASYGQAIDWKKNGIPQGAVIHINANCGSGSGNHVTFADGACTAEYLTRKDAVVPGLGGNQSNAVKRSLYGVSKVCAVRWPSELPLPPKVVNNISCGSGTDSGDGTR